MDCVNCILLFNIHRENMTMEWAPLDYHYAYNNLKNHAKNTQFQDQLLFPSNG